MPEKPLSPLAASIMGKLAALKGNHFIRLTSDQYDSKIFGGATALQIFVDDLRLEINTRDPMSPYEIELSSIRDILTPLRASYVKAYLNRQNAIEADPPPGLSDWIIENWDDVYHLICNPTPDEQIELKAFCQMLDEKRHAKMAELFRH